MEIKITSNFNKFNVGDTVEAKTTTPAGAFVPVSGGTIFVPTGFFQITGGSMPAPPAPAAVPEPPAPAPATEPAPTPATEPAPAPATEPSLSSTPEDLEGLKAYINEYKASMDTKPETAPVSTDSPTGTIAPAPVNDTQAAQADVPALPVTEPPAPAPATDSFTIADLSYNFGAAGVPNVQIDKYNLPLTEEEKKLVPKINQNFKWSAELLFTLYWAVFHDSNVLLTGLPGTGKTDAVEQFAALIGRPYVSISGKGDLEGYQVIGQNYSEGGQMVWRDGTFTQGFRNGWIIGIHEVYKIPSTIMMNLQAAFERDGVLVLDDYPGDAVDRIVNRHPLCSIISTDNTKGLGNDLFKFAAGQVQDTSFIDRMEIVLDVDYLPAPVETELLTRVTGCTEEEASAMVQLARRIRASYKDETLSLSMSLRTMFNALSMHTVTGIGFKKAVELGVVGKYVDEDEISVVQGYINTCIR